MQIDAFLPQQRLRARVYLVERRGEPAGVYGAAPDLDPLRGLHQVWRSEQPRAISRGPQPGFDHRAGGAFAVRTGHVHDAAGLLRIAQRFEQNANPLQP